MRGLLSTGIEVLLDISECNAVNFRLSSSANGKILVYFECHLVHIFFITIIIIIINRSLIGCEMRTSSCELVCRAV